MIQPGCFFLDIASATKKTREGERHEVMDGDDYILDSPGRTYEEGCMKYVQIKASHEKGKIDYGSKGEMTKTDCHLTKIFG